MKTVNLHGTGAEGRGSRRPLPLIKEGRRRRLRFECDGAGKQRSDGRFDNRPGYQMQLTQPATGFVHHMRRRLPRGVRRATCVVAVPYALACMVEPEQRRYQEAAQHKSAQERERSPWLELRPAASHQDL